MNPVMEPSRAGAPDRNAAPDGAWSLRKLAAFAGFLFAFQAGAILLTADRSGSPSVSRTPTFTIRWLPEALSSEDLMVLFAATDPSEGVLPTARGFSAESWLRTPEPRPVRIDWADGTHWLALQPGTLGEAHRLLSQETRPLLAGTGVDRPLPDTLRPPSPPVPAPLRPVSAASLDAALTARLAGPIPAVPTLRHGDVLKDSVVQLTVDAEGRVVSVRLWESGGLATADSQALEIARGLLFSFSDSAAPLTGQLRVRWATVPPTPEALP